MGIEAKPELAIDMSSWWMRKEANLLQQFAWVEDNFKDPKVQAVIDFSGNRSTDSCTEFYDLVAKVRDAAGGMYIDSSSIHHESVTQLAKFIMLKADREKETRAYLKREKIAQLQKEIASLEAEKGKP